MQINSDDILQKCYKVPSETNTVQDLWICHTCHKSIKKKKMPAKAITNNLQLNPKYEEIEVLNEMELVLCCQCIPFMFIVGKQKGSQHGLKGQCVLVPADIKKIQNVLPRRCDENHIISLTLKRRLSDKSFFSKQNIRPAFVNRALATFVEKNPLYGHIEIDPSWETVSEQTDPELWNLLTNEYASDNENEVDTDSDDNIEGNKPEEQEKISPPL